MQTKRLARAAALALLAMGSAQAAPVTYDFTGVVRGIYGSAGTAIDNPISGSFSYDPEAYDHGSVRYVQSGFFFGDPTGTAVTGTSISNLNFDLSAWQYEEVRYNIWNDPASNPVLGWTGTLTSISPRKVWMPVPEPASLMLLGLGLIGFGLVHRRRQSV